MALARRVAGRALRQRIAIPLRRIAELAVLEIEEAVFAREHAIGRGASDARARRAMNGGRKRRSRAARIARRQFVRGELLRHQAHAARQAIRDFGARHAPQALQIPSGLLHASSAREQRLDAVPAQRVVNRRTMHDQRRLAARRALEPLAQFPP